MEAFEMWCFKSKESLGRGEPSRPKGALLLHIAE